MVPKKKSKKSKEQVSYNFGENTHITGSALGPNAKVNIEQITNGQQTENDEMLLRKIHELLAELKNSVHNDATKTLSQVDKERVIKKIDTVETQIQKRDEISTPEIVLSSLKEINVILAKATMAGVVLKQIFDIAQVLFHR